MEYRRLGRTGLNVSVVGFGTNQLRLVPEQRAIETLMRGFELGVNIVHVSPDYEGAEELVARAVRQTDRKIVVASQGYDVHHNSTGSVDHFERLFESTCERLGTQRLDLYGIAAVDDREAYGENVWGRGGMVEFLVRKKEEGRLGGIFCTNHGNAAHARRLVESGVFDVMMLSYNPLGFHLLTLNPPPGRHFESLPRNRLEIFPLCRERDIGVMVMMPLAGGLLTESKAFPSRREATRAGGQVAARDILRTILQDQDVTCVLPGTASVEEAEENALAGAAPLFVPTDVQRQLDARVGAVQASHCNRCGNCDTLCSQRLPVSWLMRAHEMSTHPGEAFETWSDVEYFRLHPSLTATCATCPDVTCTCPYGIEVPNRLMRIHANMVEISKQGGVAPPDAVNSVYGDATFGARVLTRDLPSVMEPGETRVCRVYLENTGERGWHLESPELQAGVELAVLLDGVSIGRSRPRHDVHRGGRGYFVFEVTAPETPGAHHLMLHLLGEHQGYDNGAGFVVHDAIFTVAGGATSDHAPELATDAVPIPPAPVPAAPSHGSAAASDPDGVVTAGKTGDERSSRRASGWRSVWRKALLGSSQEKPEPPRGSALAVPEPAPPSDGLEGSEPESVTPVVVAEAAPVLTLAVDAHDAAAPTAAAPRPAQTYDVGWLGHNLPETWQEGEPFFAYVEVENRGTRPWRVAPEDGCAVSMVVRLNRDVHTMPGLPHDVHPGERALMAFPLTLPKGLGDWELSLSFVEQNVAWFDQQGVAPLAVRVGRALAPQSALSHARIVAQRANPSFYAPSQGIPRSRDGRAFPLILQEANGARVRDAAGNEWIDYVMGWGSALLGYAHPAIRAALAETLDCAPVISLPHMLEMEVTETLCELIPCAEQVLFGKNGSDVCTAAVRAARLHTGREIVLFSGYHGWQEPFAQAFEPALMAEGELLRAISFRMNDLEGLCSLVKAHAGRIAAIMLEPAAQAEGIDGPVRDCDPAFLRQAAQICREQGAVLIFDEIMTGFRYSQGSVQQATGVIPDLAVFGKAMAAGLPLSVLVGRTAILGPTLSRLFYHPTFKGDVYGFAAARAALGVYRTQDVSRHIREFGGRLKAGVEAISRQFGVDGRLIGLPYRMVYRFDEPDDARRALLRTLLQQELLKNGVLTFRGFMLPSLAHGAQEIEQTLAAFRVALAVVERTARNDSFASSLEMPIVT